MDPVGDRSNNLKHSLFRGHAAWRYGLAPAAVAVAFAVRLALLPILQEEALYLFFVPAVLFAAGVGGLGPGLLATALSALLGLLVVGPLPSLSASEAVNAAA